jgi:FkbM family methyltransferase
MLKRKWMTLYNMYREGGVKKVYDYLWLRLQVFAKEDKSEVRLDRCKFSLTGIADGSMRIELMTNKYEQQERRAIRRYIRRNLPVVELGGSMGVVACVTNKILKDRTAHLVVEANPLAIPHLELNRKLNGCKFEIVNRAISYGADAVTFRPSSNMCGNSITADGDQPPVTVATAQLGGLLRDREFGQFNLVCDIEGIEYDLVCHEAEVLEHADTIIMETHARFIGVDKYRLMMDKLERLGFRIVEETGFVAVLRR